MTSKFVKTLVSNEPNPIWKQAVIIAKTLYEEGKYEECIDWVNSFYGWAKGELDKEYTMDKAVWCLLEVVSDVDINDFTLCKNTSGIDSNMKYNIYHPIYDGAYMVYSTNELADAIAWCTKENYDLWTERLL